MIEIELGISEERQKDLFAAMFAVCAVPLISIYTAFGYMLIQIYHHTVIA